MHGFVLPKELRVSHPAKEFYPLDMKQNPTRKTDAWGTLVSNVR